MKFAIDIQYGVAIPLQGVVSVGETDLILFDTFEELTGYIIENALPVRGGHPLHVRIPTKELLQEYITDKELTIEDGTLEEMKQAITGHYESEMTE